MKPLGSALIALAPLFLLAGCSQPSGSADAAASTSSPSVTEVAASGIAEVLGAGVSGQPIPRDGLPDYVETREGGRYLTGMTFSNDLRQGGMVMYAAPGPLADVVAFHRASLERHGMTATEATVHPVRDYMETRFRGQTADGRSSLSVTIIDKSEPDMIVQLSYEDEKE